MAHSQAGMAALRDVYGWPSKAIDQEIPEPLRRAWKILRRIHRTQQVIVWNLLVERGYQPFKSLLADNRIDLVFFH
jgi:hypothetical protein